MSKRAIGAVIGWLALWTGCGPDAPATSQSAGSGGESESGSQADDTSASATSTSTASTSTDDSVGSADSTDSTGTTATGGPPPDCSEVGEGLPFTLEPPFDSSAGGPCELLDLVESGPEARYELACEGDLAALTAVTLYTSENGHTNLTDLMVDIRIDGDQTWVRGLDGNGLLFGGIDAQTVTPADDPLFFDPVPMMPFVFDCELQACEDGGPGQRPAGLRGENVFAEPDQPPPELAPGQSGILGWSSGYLYMGQLHEAREGSCSPDDPGQSGWFSVAINMEISL